MDGRCEVASTFLVFIRFFMVWGFSLEEWKGCFRNAVMMDHFDFRDELGMN